MFASALNDHLQQVKAVTSDKPVVAFFDLDRTLIAGYSIAAMARERIRAGLSRRELAQSSAILRDLIRQRNDKTIKGSAYHKLVRRLSKNMQGISEATLTRLGERAYENTIARSIYNEGISLLEAHRAAGHKLVIVTAATHYQVAPIARVLGVDDICCTGLEVIDGNFTGQVLAPLCYGEGKAIAARRMCKRYGASMKESWFYSDSIDDLPLLRAVGRPVAVNPSEKLGVHARAQNWPQLHFDSRGTPSIETMLRTLLTLQTVAASTALGAISRRLGVGPIENANRVGRLIGEVGSGFAGIDLEVEGMEHLSKERPAVFIFNHQSMLDPLVLAHLLREDVVALCKREAGNNRLLGPLLRQMDTIFVEREEKNQNRVLKQALGVLEQGRSLLIAPEGTRSTLGEIQPFKHGAFFLAKRAGVPVIPIVLHNVKDALPKGGLLVRSATIRVTVLPSMHPAKMGGVRQACESMEHDYAAVMGNSDIAGLPYPARQRRSA